MRVLRLLALFAAVAALAAGLTSSQARDDKGQWVTVKGQVIMSKPPEKKPVAVTTDKAHCESKGVLSYEDIVVDPKTKGVKNVVVWLRPDTPDRKAEFPKDKVKPELAKVPPKTIQIDQPTCQFTPRVFAARVGDSVEFKNSAPVNHNINFSTDDPANTFNVNLTPNQTKKTAPLTAQRSPLTFKCDIHPWMQGRGRVFDHPYFAVTDAEGKFEIKDAPAGKWRIVYWHEDGFHMGAKGAAGFEVELSGATMELKPVDLELPK